MSDRKNIEDLFRDNQHKLSQAPSGQSWRRLERRLDDRRVYRMRPRPGYRILSMAAALLFLAVFAFLLVIGFGDQRSRLMALNQSPKGLEQLDAEGSDYDRIAVSQQAMVSQYAQAQRQRTISEGMAWQKLVPSGQNKEKAAAHLPRFRWLAGKWQSLAPDGKHAVLEEWDFSGSRAMVGRAIQNGQTLERMRLYESDHKLYFSSDFGTGQPERYELVVLNEREAVFENPALEFPQQVVLRRESPSRLTVIYQDSGMSNSDATRLQALQARHQLASQRAVRQLSRLALQ